MTTLKKQVPLAEGLFTWPSDDPRLIGTRCKVCGHHFFPKTYVCQNPSCRSKDVENVNFSKRGKINSYSIQYYQPPPPYVPPNPFVPFAIALVEFEKEGLRIIGQMTDCNPEKDLKIGMEVEMVVEKLSENEKGEEVMVWKFRPVKK